MEYFAWLGPRPYNAYGIVEFDKVHFMDLGITRPSCDLKKSVIRRQISLPMGRLMAIINNGFLGLLPSRLGYHRSYRTSSDERQAGISGKFWGQSTPFLWCCLVLISDCKPDNDCPLKCAVQPDSINAVLCQPTAIKAPSIEQWKGFLFGFGRCMAQLFNVNVSTKVHRLMRHFGDHLFALV